MTGVNGPSRERFAGWTATTALALGIFVLWIEANLGGDDVTLAVADLGNLAAALGATFACARRARQETGRPQRGWRALAVACGLWSFGVAYVTYFDLWVQRGIAFADRELPFPSLADAGYLGFVPFALVGVALIPRGIFRHELRLRNALDGALVALALLAVAWTLVLRGMVQHDVGTPTQTLLALAYPLADVLLAVTAACAWSFVPAEERGNLLLVVVGLSFLALADFGFFTLVERDVVGISAINALWPAGFACLALGAGRPADAPAVTPARSPVRRGLVTLTALGGLLVIAFNVLDGRLDGVLGGVAFLLAVTVAARASLPALERRRLRAAQAKHAGEP